jgi:hypothetical protein
MRLFDRDPGEPDTLAALRNRLLIRFLRREDGTITSFALIIFVLMVAVAGIAIDVMRYETQRVQLQYTLDRAVLAAASVTQPLNPVEVVEDYFDISGLEGYRLSVNVDEGVNWRRVTANAEMEINTFFMHMFGVRVLTSPAEGAAEEIVPQLEISLVLDISGSMREMSHGVRRIDRLRPAAQGFINNMLMGDRAQATTISIVPYAGQVNPGQTVFNMIGGAQESVTYTDSDGVEHTRPRDHDRSFCVEFDATDFTTWHIPSGRSFEQVPHFMKWPIASAFMDWGWCPLEGNVALNENSSAIQYFSNNAGELNEFISRMRLHDGTGTHYGMQWGLWLLHPDSNWAVQNLAATGVVDTGFANRPAAFDDRTTRKVIVLMTDGRITRQVRPTHSDRTQPPINATDENDVFLNHTEELNRRCGDTGPCQVEISSESNNRSRFYAACNAAKANDVVIFTIAFDVTNGGENEMRNCASAPAYFYHVEGADLQTAFQSIAGAINGLRLVPIETDETDDSTG